MNVYQYREDAAHNGFDDDDWVVCSREVYGELAGIIGDRPFARMAGGHSGAWREDNGGWPIEVRVLCDVTKLPPYQWNRGQLIGVLMFAYGSILPPATARTFAEAVVEALDNNEVVRALINHLRENPE